MADPQSPENKEILKQVKNEWVFLEVPIILWQSSGFIFKFTNKKSPEI